MTAPSVPRIALSGCLAAILIAGCSRKQVAATAPASAQKQAVEVAPVVRRDLIETLSLVGSLAANESAQIRPEIAGQVREVMFNEGDRVTKGQLLMKIDDSELRAQLAQAEARFHLAELNLRRSENLTEARSMSQAEADRFRSEFAATQAEQSLLRVRLDKTGIKAPFDGVVGARSVSPGDYVTTQSVVTTIDDLSRLKIDFQVPERFVEKVRAGTAFTVKSNSSAGAKPPTGEVYFVSSVIDRATRSSQVKGFVAAGTSTLKPGMFANVELVLEIHVGALTVPEGAILTLPAGTQVIAARASGSDKIAEFVAVRTGLRARGYVEIAPLKGGLDEGTEVVAAGVGALILFPGAKLDPRPLREETRTAP